MQFLPRAFAEKVVVALGFPDFNPGVDHPSGVAVCPHYEDITVKKKPLKIEDVPLRAHNGQVSPFLGDIRELPLKFVNLFNRRFLENFARHGLNDEDARYEARMFISKLIWREQTKRLERKKQLALFDIGVKPQRQSMRVAEQGGGR